MKVLVFNGSPNEKGNTAAILNAIKSGAQSEKAEVKTVELNQLKMKGCQSCYGCQQPSSTGECVMSDALKPLYKDIYEADVIVFGSPIYMGQMTSQAKQLFDRFFPILKPDFTSRLSSKKTVLVYTHGQPDANTYKLYIDHTSGAFSMMGFNIIDTIIANGMYAPGMAEKSSELMEKATQLGKKMGK